jgi:hypothetical protein
MYCLLGSSSASEFYNPTFQNTTTVPLTECSETAAYKIQTQGNYPEDKIRQECLGLLDQRKQAKMQWMQDPSQSNVENLNKARQDASRHLSNKRKHI